MIIFGIAVVGLSLGSFINALVWRLYQQQLPAKRRVAPAKQLSIATGRSMCPSCKHVLSTVDLFPVVSWLALRGKCRYCHSPVSTQYPLVELLTSLLFVTSYVFWPTQITTFGQGIIFAGWLLALVGLIALTVYDIKWMILPNRIVFPLIGLGAILAVCRALQSDNVVMNLISSVLAVAVAGGLFYILFQISAGKWIGGGDVKLGFALGLLLGTPGTAFLMLFTASILGLLYSLPQVVLKKTKMSAQIPFGPFLITATIICMLWGEQVIRWYSHQFLFPV